MGLICPLSRPHAIPIQHHRPSHLRIKRHVKRIRNAKAATPDHADLFTLALATASSFPANSSQFSYYGYNEKGDAPCTEPDAPPNIRSFKLRLRHSGTASHNAAHDEVTAGASR